MKYERLTKKDQDWFEFTEITDNEIYTRLQKLENKIENGTLVELPCKVGDAVWYIKADGEVIWVDEMIVKGFEFSKCNKVIFIVGIYLSF